MAAEKPSDSQDILYTTGSPQQQPNSNHLNWGLLQQNVREKQKLFVSLASRVPTSFTFRTINGPSGPFTRLYFLGIPNSCRENTLLYVDIPNETREITPSLSWKNFLESFQPSLPSVQLSREEQLMRERKRLGVYGITSYDVVVDEGKFVFPACNSLYTCADSDLNIDDPVHPSVISTNCPGARLDPKICPRNSSLIAFVHKSDVWVTNVDTGQECRLTFVHKGSDRLVEDPLSAGIPSFVVQEEFDRYTGYWWEPKHSGNSDDKHYRILYEETDESEVEILNLYAAMTDTGQGIEEYRYPRAGTANAKSCLKIVEFDIGTDGQESFTEKQLYEPLTSFFPWMEYLIRAGWTPDAKFVYAQLLDRQQTRLCLVLIPVECFVPVTSDPDMELNYYYECSSSYPLLQVIYEDKSDVWVNVHDILHFFPQTKKSETTFLWSSEKTGHRHLYKVTTKLESCDKTLCAMDLLENEQNCLSPVVLSETPLTSGEWQVQGKQIWVDESRSLVYFIGFKDTVLETHLYVVSLSSPQQPQRLTELGYTHMVSISNDFSMFVTVYSSVQQAPVSVVHQICHSESGQINTKALGTVMSSVSCSDYCAPELFNFQNCDNLTIHGLYFKPHGYDAAKDVRYPTVLMVYGGPQVQQVTNSFKGLRFLRHHTLASQGYAVVVIDGRGSSQRGLQFEAYIKHRLGTVEIADQVEGLQWLSEHVNFIDINRVAIHGWSYGGYLSLLGLAQRPDFFKIAIAGAPVVSWNLYDTGYTERYLDTPANNERGYKLGSVLYYIYNFPEVEDRLLIIHGLIDENVHFQHTSQLVNGLVKACKPYNLQVYPNERHGIRNHEASEHYKTMILSFLQRHL